MLSQRGWAVVLFFNLAFIASRSALCIFGKKKYSKYPTSPKTHSTPSSRSETK